MSPHDGQEEPLRRLGKIVTSFMSRPDAAPFLEPVDWRGLELFDYPEIITKMMDLGTIKRKLERKQYTSAWECAQDIKLVWQNCMSYNAEGSELWLVAKSFNRKFEDKFRRIRQEFDISEEKEAEGEDEDNEEDQEEEDEEEEDEEQEFGDGDSTGVDSKGAPSKSSSNNGGPSLDARAQLASNLILLHGTELGHIMHLLEHECPSALVNVNDDNDGPAIPEKTEINLDLLDNTLFYKISQFAAEKASGRKRGLATDDVELEDVSGKRKRRR